ncbi:MAG: hypothetical protein JST90_11865 [Bacteroidetes bacterium]|nr:hypothetical protein [Bacteroidota bacterium]
MIGKTAFTMIAVALLIFSSHDSVARDIGLSRASIKRFHIKEILADSNTFSLVKDIYLDKPSLFSSSNDFSFLTILDSFPKMDTYHKGFYFVTIAKSYHRADGAYAEGLGAAGLSYVRDHRKEFANYFIGRGKLPDIYIELWSNICCLEYSLLLDNDKASADNFISSILEKGLSADETDRMMSFDALLFLCSHPAKIVPIYIKNGKTTPQK